MEKDKHVWEGWTVGDFIDELEITFKFQSFKSKMTLKTGVNQSTHITRNTYQKYIPTSYKKQIYNDKLRTKSV